VFPRRSDEQRPVPPPTVAGRLAFGADQRLSLAKGSKSLIRKAFPDHWSFLLGELALYSFVILVATGIWLAMFYRPGMQESRYTGSYTPLRGVSMSQAYTSVLDISFDVRGGLLVRQIHHWSALVFVGAIMLHMLRIFFSGAFRKPRELNWVIGVTMMILAIAEGFAGYSLPDDLLSGEGLRIMNGIVLSIPIVGSYLAFFIFGGAFPGHIFLSRLFTAHILLLPGLLAGLITAHLLLVFYQKHTQWPAPGHTNENVVGKPMFPAYITKSVGLLLALFGAIAVLAALVQINPVWLYGPYKSDQASTASQPDWYMNFLEGALRLMPNWETTGAGHTVSWNVLVPGVLMPIALFGVLYAYPFVEEWTTGPMLERHLLDRPRDRPTRTGLGAAGIAYFALLTFAGSDDVAVLVFRINTNGLVVLLRVLVFVLPVIVFFITRRVCVELQRHDWRAVVFGRDSGKVGELPQGGYAAPVEQLDQGERYRLTARDDGPLNPLVRGGRGGVLRRMTSWTVRSLLVHWERRHRVSKPTFAQYDLARRGRWITPWRRDGEWHREGGK
jgi:ubiquinol-cytochrome c reductase cytochrome b subunit